MDSGSWLMTGVLLMLLRSSNAERRSARVCGTHAFERLHERSMTPERRKDADDVDADRARFERKGLAVLGIEHGLWREGQRDKDQCVEQDVSLELEMANGIDGYRDPARE